MKAKRKILSLLLCGTMLFSLCSQSVLAEASAQDSGIIASSLCEHHTEHDEDCGYTEGTAGSLCTHEHTDDCYTEVIDCTHEHDEDCYPQDSVSDNDATPSDAEEREPENCPHICGEDSGCITKELNCQHEHDDECGYAPATEGTPCGYVCEICAAENSGNAETTSPSNAKKASAVERVQAMIDALPEAEEIGKDNAEEVRTQLEAIDEAKAELTDEELDQLDITRYVEAVTVLGGAVATPFNAVMLANYSGSAIVLGTDHLEGGQASNVYFGNYPQSDTSGNQKDPVKWRVLSNADDKLFLLADQNLDVQKYNTTYTSVTWETCSLRTWLNGTFLNNAFSNGEQGAISETNLENANNPTYGTAGGNATNDKVFLLSIAEANNSDYFPNGNSSRVATNTAYVANYSGMYGVGVAAHWWLRSPGYSVNRAAYVRAGGGVNYFGYRVAYTSSAVRPAFKLNLNSVLFTSAAVGGKIPAAESGGNQGGEAADAIFKIPTTATSEWKLTLLDSTRNFSITETSATANPGGTIKLNYTNATTGENEYISVIITGNNGALYYGRVARATNESGTVDITIPVDITDGSYTLKIFNEQYNGGDADNTKKTDYASAFKDVALTVKTTKYSVNVQNDGNGSASASSTSAAMNEEITLTATPNTGYQFKAWEVISGGVTITDDKFTMPAENVTVKATFEAETYTVTLNANGGTIADGKDATSYTYGVGATLPTAEDVTRTGYTFTGWYEDNDFSGSAVTEISSTETGDKTFYADWVRNTTPIIPGNTVRYIVEHYKADASSNTGYALADTEYLAGEIGATVTATPKTYDGFTYNAEKSTASGTLKAISSADDIVALKLYYDETLYAVTVKGGTGTGEYTEGAAVTITATVPNGKRFVSWTIVPEVSFTSGGKDTATAVFTMPAEAVTITANFKNNSSGGSSSGDSDPTYYTLTFETGGGSSISAISAAYGKTIDLSGYAPTRDGYDFSGWYSDKELTQKITEIRLNGNKTVYAGWTKHNPGTGTNPFTDVSANDWFYDDVMFVYENGLMSGTSATTFSPYANTTRAQIAVIFWRLDGSPAVEGKNSFTDVEYGPGTAWYYDAATWAQQNDIMAGYGDGRFGPNDPVTREQLAAIFYRYAQAKSYDVTATGSIERFTDKGDVSQWAQEAMKWAVGRGILNGRGNNILDPQGTATRAEIAAMLHRFIESYNLSPAATTTGSGGNGGGTSGWVQRTASPQTGDSSHTGLWLFTLCTSAGALIALLMLKRRDEEESRQPA